MDSVAPKGTFNWNYQYFAVDPSYETSPQPNWSLKARLMDACFHGIDYSPDAVRAEVGREVGQSVDQRFAPGVNIDLGEISLYFAIGKCFADGMFLNIFIQEK